MQKITTILWFNDQAEEAMKFYVAIFKNSRVVDVSRFGEGALGQAGKVMTATFELEGQQFIALNGGPEFRFTEAISLLVNCETQQEIDELWRKLTAGGEEGQCGWLKDKYGLSWQFRTQGDWRATRRQGSTEGPACDAGDACDEEDRYCGAEARVEETGGPD
jgi:predicted 3-demethylubiquinone-9 3-methyltransferase (glyoxalase superfamily)